MRGPSAVAFIETPDSFVLEDRPDLPGQLENPGMLQFFGGHVKVDAGEDPHDAVVRELGEELKLAPLLPLQRVWEGEVDIPGSNGSGPIDTRTVTLFRVAIGSVDDLHLSVPGRIVELPKTQAALNANKARMTGFTHLVLTHAVRR